MHQTSQSTHYWWCWLAIGEMIAYILVMNLAIPVLLAILPGKHVCLQHNCLSSPAVLLQHPLHFSNSLAGILKVCYSQMQLMAAMQLTW